MRHDFHSMLASISRQIFTWYFSKKYFFKKINLLFQEMLDGILRFTQAWQIDYLRRELWAHFALSQTKLNSIRQKEAAAGSITTGGTKQGK